MGTLFCFIIDYFNDVFTQVNKENKPGRCSQNLDKNQEKETYHTPVALK